jgi:putative aldouronate transport system permease protein
MSLGRTKATDLTFEIANYLLLTVLFLICIYPFYHILLYSLSDPVQAQKGIVLLPRAVTLGNYRLVFRLKGMLNATVVSLLRTVIGTAITVFACSFFAFLMTKEELPFRKTIYRTLLVTMYFSTGLIPWYLTMKLYHLNNNFLLYVIPSAISAYFIVIVKTFIEQLPPSLEESARMDGAGHITVFLKVIFPLSAPIVATILVFSAVGQWNTWFDNYLLVQSPKLKTLQLILYDYLSQASWLATASNTQRTQAGASGAAAMTPATIRMTVTMLVTLPIIFVYPFMQRYFVKGLMLGAIKG